MATNNAVNLKTAGLVTYDGAGIYSALAIPLTVPNGGTGVTTMLANAPICGGTTSTNPLQTTNSAGVTGQILFSNGAGILPSYQGINGFTWTCYSGNGNMGDSSTYYLRLAVAPAGTGTTSSGPAMSRCYIPYPCKLDSAYFSGNCTIVGTNENLTVAARVNDTTSTNLSTTLKMDTATFSFNATAIELSLVKGDFVEITVTTPNWGTNPVGVEYTVTLFFT